MAGGSEEEEGGSLLGSAHLHNQPVAASALTLALHPLPTAPHVPISLPLSCSYQSWSFGSEGFFSQPCGKAPQPQ